MVAFTYRMPAGFPGDVNRSHPASIEPALIDAANPPALFGGLVFADQTGSNGVRQPVPGDAGATAIPGYGLLVREFPVQQTSAGGYVGTTGAPGTPVPPPSLGPCSVLRSGYISCVLNGAAGVPTKGAPVYVWVAATTAGHIQGGLETQASAGNTVLLDGKTSFNGPPDAFNTVEIAFNV